MHATIGMHYEYVCACVCEKLPAVFVGVRQSLQTLMGLGQLILLLLAHSVHTHVGSVALITPAEKHRRVTCDTSQHTEGHNEKATGTKT